MVLGKQFYDETVFEYVYIAVLFYAFYQRVLYLGTGRVFVVQYPKFGVSALLVQVERAVGCFIEIGRPTRGAVLSVRGRWLLPSLQHDGRRYRRPQ